ncbi:MAG: tetratricopeptide repeat protein [Bacteroidota bacterium]|nr:tetratricopeptide repeat protein [Bacteroidota bacterium]
MLISLKKYLILAFLLPAFFFISGNLVAQNQQEIELANEYYSQGELEKAKAIYTDLIKDSKNIPSIHLSYLNVLMSLGSWKEAENYVSKLIKQQPENYNYKIDQGILAFKQNKSAEAQKQFEAVIESAKKDQFKTRNVASYFMNNDLVEYSLATYLSGRKVSDSNTAYALEIGNIYRLMNKKDLMVEEFLNFAQSNPNNINYVKNVLQNYLIEEEDLSSLETMLLEKVQKHPENLTFPELLIWTNLQQKNFYGAFIQARAIDKRMKTEGARVMDIGFISLENKDFKTASKVFEYVVNTFQNSPNHLIARRYLIKSREELVKNTFPIDNDEIEKLIGDYQALIDQTGLNPNTQEAMRSQALLYAFYLDRKNEASAILNKIIEMPRANPELVAASKIDLGDIHLLLGEPWESTLLYSQVEKSEKDQPIGYEAKLRNAKLSYYKGEFELAQEHLDILKVATTREIANDAMQLSLLIRDNIVFDTTSIAMREYASVELLLFQNKKDEALIKLDDLLAKHPGHSLTDEIYWLQSKIYLEYGEFEKAVSLLNNIVTNYNEDILGDDAYFKIAHIYDHNLKDKDQAMHYYQTFLQKYPGSIFTAEARKRYRILRGDLVN